MLSRRFVWLGLSLCFLVETAFAQLDSTWTLTVNGQSVQANADGSFYVPNVSAADLDADFQADNFVQVVGVTTEGGITRYAFSDFFRIRQGEAVLAPGVFPSNTPPQEPEHLELVTPSGLFTLEVGETADTQAIGTFLSNGKLEHRDLTGTINHTLLRSSNSSILSVDQETGRITGNQKGVAFVTAFNSGATTVRLFTVVPATRRVTIEGFVELPDGTPIAGATVVVSFGTGEPQSDQDGFFSAFLEVPVGEGVEINVVVTYELDGTRYQAQRRLLLGEAGILDVGVLSLQEVVDIDRAFALGAELYLDQVRVQDIEAADMNADGLTDLVVIDRDGTLHVLASSGASGFGDIVSSPTLATSVTGMTLADVNGDSSPDVILASGNGVHAFFNMGDGTLGEGPRPVDRTLGLESEVVASDLDSDGDSDLVASTSIFVDGEFRAQALVYLNDSEGNYALNETIDLFQSPTSGGSCPGIGEFDVVDVTGDNVPDIVVLQGEDETTLWVVEGRGEVGFFPPLSFPVDDGVSCFGTSRARSKMSVADFTGDEARDVVLTTVSGQLRVNNAGEGVFNEVVTLSTDDIYIDRGSNYATGDLNADSALDIVFNAADFFVLLNDGSGMFPEPKQYFGIDGPAGAQATSVADFDGDGDLDIASAGFGVRVARNAGDGTLHEERHYAFGGGARHIVTLDIELDGDLDLAVTTDAGVTIIVNTEGELASDLELPGISASFAADLNGDEFPELIGSTVSINLGEGTFSELPDIVGPPRDLADIDQDGHIDLLRQVQLDGANTSIVATILRNLGDATFEELPIQLLLPFDPCDPAPCLRLRDAALGDIDGDLRPDLGVAIGNEVIVWLNDEAGSFEQFSRLDIGEVVTVLSFVDIDQDGLDDIVGLTFGGSFVLSSTKFPELTLSAAAAGCRFVGPCLSFVSDLDEDGIGDLVTDGGILFGRTGVGFERRAVPLPPIDSAIVSGDIDGDGDVDVIVSTADGLTVLRNTIR